MAWTWPGDSKKKKEKDEKAKAGRRSTDKTHGPAEDPNRPRRATHMTYKTNERGVKHSYTQCLCTAHSSDHEI